MDEKLEKIWKASKESARCWKGDEKEFLEKLKIMACTETSQLANIDPGQLAFDCGMRIERLVWERGLYIKFLSRGGFIEDSEGSWCKEGDLVTGENREDDIMRLSYDDMEKRLVLQRVNTTEILGAGEVKFKLVGVKEPVETTKLFKEATTKGEYGGYSASKENS